MKKGCGHKSCGLLVTIAGVNYGLIGLGTLIGKDWDVLNMILGSWPTLEAIVYVIVGLSALCMLFKKNCKTCKPCEEKMM